MNTKMLLSLAALISANSLFAMGPDKKLTPKQAGDIKQRLQAILVKPLMEWTKDDANMRDKAVKFAADYTEGKKYLAAYDTMLENLAAVQEKRAKFEKDLADLTEKLDNAKRGLTDTESKVKQAQADTKEKTIDVVELNNRIKQQAAHHDKVFKEYLKVLETLEESTQKNTTLQKQVDDLNKKVGLLDSGNNMLGQIITDMQGEKKASATELERAYTLLGDIKKTLEPLTALADLIVNGAYNKEFPQTIKTELTKLTKSINTVIVKK